MRLYSSSIRIQAHGLLPAAGDGDDWKRVSPDLPAWCKGKLFLTGTKDSAENFVHQKTYEGNGSGTPVILRVPSSRVMSPVSDEFEMGNAEVFTLSPIAAEFVQIEISGEWKPISALSLDDNLGMTLSV